MVVEKLRQATVVHKISCGSATPGTSSHAWTEIMAYLTAHEVVLGVLERFLGVAIGGIGALVRRTIQVGV